MHSLDCQCDPDMCNHWRLLQVAATPQMTLCWYPSRARSRMVITSLRYSGHVNLFTEVKYFCGTIRLQLPAWHETNGSHHYGLWPITWKLDSPIVRTLIPPLCLHVFVRATLIVLQTNLMFGSTFSAFIYFSDCRCLRMKFSNSRRISVISRKIWTALTTSPGTRGTPSSPSSAWPSCSWRRSSHSSGDSATRTS